MAPRSNVVPLDTLGTYRKDTPTAPLGGGGEVVILADRDLPGFDSESNTTQVETEDGGVIISFGPPREEKQSSDFDDNLAEYLDESELQVIAEKLLAGIEQDSQSRADWMTNLANGISLLGLEVKGPKGAAATTSPTTEGVSTVDHPLLLEAVLRFQANARGELLPADGPIKVRNDGEGNELNNRLAQALEKDMNRYLTKTATEYYPDTDRMLLMLGFCGISFKKGYHDPIKRRPVIASIDAKDLIVSNAATDIEGAGRVTHSFKMRPSTIKRMQIVGAYRDVDLGAPAYGTVPNPVEEKIQQVQGVVPTGYIEPEDKERDLYECYCEIEVPGFEHVFEGEETGLPQPYKVVLERESRKVLEIRRNWHEDDPLSLPRNRIIAYTFIPGFGFYGMGLLNVLGNATKAVTAAWRLMLDAGMFANFPGFLYLKTLQRQVTNQFRVPPGGGAPIDLPSGMDIRAGVMPLPYKDPSAVFIQLIENIATQAQRVGGTAELQVGEGKQDAPVGTTLAMIEQATKLMSAVHKRAHTSQGQEFDMLKSLLMEDPEALWRHNPKKSEVLKVLSQHLGLQSIEAFKKEEEVRHKQLIVAALGDMELTPRSDPNTSSQTERYMKIVALRQMAETNQNIDKNKVDERGMRAMGIDDPETYFIPPQPKEPSPEEKMAQATLLTAQARLQDSQTKIVESQLKGQNVQLQSAVKREEIESRQKIAALGVAKELIVHQSQQAYDDRKLSLDSAQRTAERASKAHLTALGLAAREAEGVATRNNSMVQHSQQLHHDRTRGGLDRAHELWLEQLRAKARPPAKAKT